MRIQISVWDICLKRICSLDTGAFSVLEVLGDINYLLTYLKPAGAWVNHYSGQHLDRSVKHSLATVLLTSLLPFHARGWPRIRVGAVLEETYLGPIPPIEAPRVGVKYEEGVLLSPSQPTREPALPQPGQSPSRKRILANRGAEGWGWGGVWRGCPTVPSPAD